jgi:hypothetical protein
VENNASDGIRAGAGRVPGELEQLRRVVHDGFDGAQAEHEPRARDLEVRFIFESDRGVLD